MPKTRPPYWPEFRRQMVELVRAGRSPEELAREFEPTAQSICHWVAQADRKEGRREEKGDGLAAAERDELARLRRENKQLRLERDILSRAAAWFAREKRPLGRSPGGRASNARHGAIPSGSSNS
jgi:transposase